MIQEQEGYGLYKSVAVEERGNSRSVGEACALHLLSKHQLALALGVSPRTIDTWKAHRKIPFLRISPRLVRYNLERVKTALARYEVKEVGVAR